MKKLVCTLFIISFATALFAQDDDKGDKKVKLGISVTPALNWLTPDNANKVKPGGVALKAGIGLVVDIRLTNIIWLHTGLEYTGAGGKLNYTGNDTAFYYYKDDKINPVGVNSVGNPYNSTGSSNGTSYRLTNRAYKVGYVHLPIGFKLKTKELGGITYFGQIGGDLFFKTSANGKDDVAKDITGTTSTFSKNSLDDAVNFFNAAAHVGAGLEYRISGSTALMASLQYRHGMTNFTADATNNLLRTSGNLGNSAISQFSNGSKLRQVVLTVAIMF
ncbi:MAG TPA: outer membrane beta-barrel protein [Bacteroidia bacterium]|jgi:hypothetical protein|nr:outer membrane beta-barrel protein [Bacteroidia bacterium]